MSFDRRTFLARAAAAGVSLRTSPASLLSRQMGQMAGMPGGPKPGQAPESGMAPPPMPILHSLALTPFVDELPQPQPAKPVGPNKLRITMREIHAKVHRDVPPTRMWSYGDTATGPLVIARAGQALEIEWVNQLPRQHFLPVDHSLHGCGPDVPDVRTIVHVHGARVATKYDGHPDDWYVPGQSLKCVYDLHQDATTLWYHDHAMGVNRLNHYAGLFAPFWLRDAEEDALHLPRGAQEVSLVLYDRNFTQDGQLYYPTSGDPEHPWVSEFAGDAILINGKIRPYLHVEPRLYRFRVVNAANSRFFRLSVAQPGANPHVPQTMLYHQIGGDQGLLAAPVAMEYMTMGPGERGDFLVDLSQCAGQTVHLRNNAFEILQFRVASGPVVKAEIPAKLRTVDRQPESTAVTTRRITLNEYQDKVGNSMLMLLNRKHWHEAVTERVKLNTSEIWEFVNLTEDVHPMHLHLARFQILDRRTFERDEFLRREGLNYKAPALPPAPNEMGWKDVVQCSPSMVTRVLVRFERHTGSYLYHCHILEHEANDMMRPFEVIA